MEKDKITDFFGKGSTIPSAVPVKISDLTQPNFSINVEDAVIDDTKDEGVGETDEGMFSGNMDEMLSDMEGRLKNGEMPDEIDIPDKLWIELDELGAETIIEVWEEMRLGGHKALYNWTIYSEPKKVKKIVKHLTFKDNKTPEEKELLKKMYNFVEKHDDVRSSYMSAVPYNEKHKSLLIRVVDIQLKKMKLQDKKIPMWLLWTYLLIAPEVKMGVKLYGLKDELPQIDFSINDIK